MLRMLLLAIVTLATFAPQASAIYDPATGRWITRDPAGYVDGSNLYRYGGANPVRFVDPMGLEDEPVDKYRDGSPNFNNTERELWKKLGPLEKLGMKNAFDTAIESVQDPKYDGTRHNGPGDAVRHCVWNCEMTRRVNERTAKDFGDAHEESSTNDDETKMDLHNNELGRELGKKPKYRRKLTKGGCYTREKISGRSCKEMCEKALADGKLELLPKDRWN